MPESLKKLEAYAKKTPLKEKSDLVDVVHGNQAQQPVEDETTLPKRATGLNVWKITTYVGIIATSTLAYMAFRRKQ